MISDNVRMISADDLKRRIVSANLLIELQFQISLRKSVELVQLVPVN